MVCLSMLSEQLGLFDFRTGIPYLEDIGGTYDQIFGLEGSFLALRWFIYF